MSGKVGRGLTGCCSTQPQREGSPGMRTAQSSRSRQSPGDRAWFTQGARNNVKPFPHSQKLQAAGGRTDEPRTKSPVGPCWRRG